MSENEIELGLSTRAIHAGSPPPAPGAPVVPPLVMSSTFYGGQADESAALRYTRYGNNPNQEQVAAKMAATVSIQVLGNVSDQQIIDGGKRGR